MKIVVKITNLVSNIDYLISYSLMNTVVRFRNNYIIYYYKISSKAIFSYLKIHKQIVVEFTTLLITFHFKVVVPPS